MNDRRELNNSPGRNFLRGTLILTVAGIVVKVIGSLNWIILSRVMGGEGIGLYQMAVPIYVLALSVSSAGIPTAISIITAEKLAFYDYRGANRVFHTSLAVLTVSGLLFSLLMFFGAEWLIEYRFIRDPRAYYSLVALAPAIFFVTILSSFRGYLQGWQIMTPTAVSQIVEQLFRVFTMVIFASMLLPRGLEYAAGGASLGALPGAVAGLLILIFYYWRLRRKFQAAESGSLEILPQESRLSIIRRIIKLALPVSLANLMTPVVANIDLLIVPARLEVAGFAVEQATELFGYLTGMAVPLVNLSTILTASLATSLVPAISEAHSLQDKQRVYQRTAAAMRLAVFITVPSFVGLYLLASPISELIYHAPKAAESVSILALGVFLLGIHQVTTGVLQGMGHTTILVINMGLSAVIKVILNWTLTAIPELGIKGAAWATVADFGVAAVLNMYYVHRYVGFSMDYNGLAKSSLAAVIMGGVVYLLYNQALAFTASMTLATTAAIICGAVIYTLVLLLIGGINERDLAQVPRVGGKIVAFLRRLGFFKPEA